MSMRHAVSQHVLADAGVLLAGVGRDAEAVSERAAAGVVVPVAVDVVIAFFVVLL